MEQSVISSCANWALIATPIIIAIGLYFAYRECVSVRNARIAQTIVSLMSVWDSDGMAESRRKVNESGKNLQVDYEVSDEKNELDSYTSYIRVANFFDGLGALVAEGYLDVRIAYDHLGKAEKTYYMFYEPMITSSKYEGYVRYFIKLHELFTKEEARRSKTKQRRAS